MKRTRLLLADDHPLSPPENSRIHSGILLRLRKSAAPFALSSLGLEGRSWESGAGYTAILPSTGRLRGCGERVCKIGTMKPAF